MISRLLDTAVEAVCLLLMVILTVDLMLGVFSRYVLARTFTWYDEIARAAFVWVVFLGAAVGVKRGAHFRLHLLVDVLPRPLQRVALGLGLLIVMGFSVVLVQQGRAFTELGRVQTLPVSGVSKAWVYAAIPVGGVLIIVYTLPRLWRVLAGRE